jgi:hypothetical protein
LEKNASKRTKAMYSCVEQFRVITTRDLKMVQTKGHNASNLTPVGILYK